MILPLVFLLPPAVVLIMGIFDEMELRKCPTKLSKLECLRRCCGRCNGVARAAIWYEGGYCDDGGSSNTAVGVLLVTLVSPTLLLRLLRC